MYAKTSRAETDKLLSVRISSGTAEYARFFLTSIWGRSCPAPFPKLKRRLSAVFLHRQAHALGLKPFLFRWRPSRGLLGRGRRSASLIHDARQRIQPHHPVPAQRVCGDREFAGGQSVACGLIRPAEGRTACLDGKNGSAPREKPLEKNESLILRSHDAPFAFLDPPQGGESITRLASRKAICIAVGAQAVRRPISARRGFHSMKGLPPSNKPPHPVRHSQASTLRPFPHPQVAACWRYGRFRAPRRSCRK